MGCSLFAAKKVNTVLHCQYALSYLASLLYLGLQTACHILRQKKKLLVSVRVESKEEGVSLWGYLASSKHNLLDNFRIIAFITTLKMLVYNLIMPPQSAV